MNEKLVPSEAFSRVMYSEQELEDYGTEELSRTDLQSPVVLRSEYEDLLSLARDMYQSLDIHCGDPITKAYKSRIEKYDG